MALHSAEVAGSIHVSYNFSYANAAARNAAVLAATDVGKIARQTDDNSFWILQDDSPLTWTRLDHTDVFADNVFAVQDNGDATKQFNVSLGGATTGTTSTIVSSQTANRSLTLPDATTTLVGTGVAQTLTNKTFGDAIIGTQIATPANPGAGLNKLYFKNDGILYSLSSGGVESAIGSGAAMSWSTVAGTSQTLAATNGYVTSNIALTTFTLPAAASVGDTYIIVGNGAGGWAVTPDTGQVLYRDTKTIVGNTYSLLSDHPHSCVTIVCTVTNTTFEVINSQGATTPTTPEVGVFALGSVSGTPVNTLDTITITSAANSTDFGDLTVARTTSGTCASSTRGLIGGGSTGSDSNVIDHIQILSPGNAVDFGDLSVTRAELAGASNETRGTFAGGAVSGVANNTIDYVAIATLGNAADFSDLTVARFRVSGLSSLTRGIFGGGTNAGNRNEIDFIVFSTLANATDFGDLTVARGFLAACSSNTRGIFGGGVVTSTQNNTLDYISQASAANAVDFGDLTSARWGLGACAGFTRGVWGGGFNGSVDVNILDFVVFSTLANATDFGDLSATTFGTSGLSNAHGGL